MLADRRLVDHLELGHPAPDVEHADAASVVDKLEEVPVPGDDLDLAGRPRGEGADHVVSLVAVRLGHRDAGGARAPA